MLGFDAISSGPISALAATGPATQYGVVDTTSTVTRTNLVPNPSFEVNTTGWASANAIERVTSYHQYRNAALACYTVPGQTDTNMAYTTTATTTQTGNHVISVWVFCGAGSPMIGKTITLSVEGGTATVTPGASTPATFVADTWVRASLVVNVTGNGTVLFVCRLSVAPSTLADYTAMVLDGAMMELGSTLLPYFDGATAVGVTPTAQSWSGTADNSSSSITYDMGGHVQLSTAARAGDMPRSQAATGVTVTPTVAVAGSSTKPQTATGTTVAPATAASGTVTRFGVAPAVTVAPVVAAAPAPMTKSSTVLCDITPFAGTDLFPNTSAETDLTDWSANTYGSISRVTTDAHDGTASALNTGAIFGPYGTTFATGQYMTAGRAYRATVWYKYLSGSNASWRMFSTTGGNSPDFGAATGAWQQGTYELNNAVATQSFNDIQMRHGSNANVGSTFLTDDFHLYDITRVIETQASGTVVRAATADFVHTITTESANLVSNGTFETDMSGWSYSPVTLYWRADGGHTGTCSANMSPPAPGASARARTYITVSSLTSQLRVKVWAKLETTGGNDRMTIWLVNPNEADVVTSPASSEVRITKDQWALYEWVFTDISAVNATTFFLQVMYMNDVSGGVRFDDVSAVEIIPGSIAPSATPVITNFGAATTVTVGPESSTERVTNGTFESASVTPWYGVFDPAYGSTSAGFLTSTNQAHTGTYSGYMYPMGLPLPKIGNDITFADHKPYVRISFWAWQFSGSLTTLSACVTDAALTNPQWAAAQNVNALNTWQYYSFDIDLSVTSLTGPSLTAMIRAGSNSAWFYLDDISILEVIPAAEVVAAAGLREVTATADVTITPTTAADGTVVGGAVNGDDALTITPTTAAAGVTDHLVTATDPAVTPTVTASAVTTHLATATAVTITPVTTVVPLPITDQATADITVTPVPAATSAALTKTSTAADVVSPIATSVPSAVLKSSDAAVTDTPVPAATAAPITKTASAATSLGGGASPVFTQSQITLPYDWYYPAGLDSDPTPLSWTFDTTSIPASATIVSFDAAVTITQTSGSAAAHAWIVNSDGVSSADTVVPFSPTTVTLHNTSVPVTWRALLGYSLYGTNWELYVDGVTQISAISLTVVYELAGIVTTATLGPKTSSGDAAVTVSPATAATGVSTGSNNGTAFLTITPASTADAAGIARSSTATDTPVAPAAAAAGTASKAIDAPAVTITPTSAASATVTKPATATAVTVSLTTAATALPITDTATASVTISPVTAATAAPIVDTATADTAVNPVSTATPAAMTKTATASITVTPTPFTTSSTAGQDAVTITPVSAASGSVTRMGTANVTVTPTPSTVVPLREAMAALAFTVSLTTNAAGRYTALGQADVIITALSDAQAVYTALGSASTTITPVPFAKVGADWTSTAALVIAASTHADGRTRRPERWGVLRI